MKIIRKMFKSKKAQSMVEMAILLPVLLLILFSIIEFGRILGAYMIMHDLAREGVRAGVVGQTNREIMDHIEGNDSFLAIVDGNITITPDVYANRSVGDPLTVRIDYQETIITPIVSSIVSNPIDMSAEYVMRIENVN